MEDSVFAVPYMQSFGTHLFGDANLQFDRHNSAIFCPNDHSSLEKEDGAVASPNDLEAKPFSQCQSPFGSNMPNGTGGNMQQRCTQEAVPVSGGEDASCICKDCGKKFGERSLLLRHRVVHSEAKYICEFCQRAFVRDDKRKRHIRCVHSHERPFVCEVCAKAFARKDKLQEHARHHNRDITFPCPVCPDLFVMRSHLNRHLRNVHNLKYTPVTSSSSTAATGVSDNTSVVSGVNGVSSSPMGLDGPTNVINGDGVTTAADQSDPQIKVIQFKAGTEMVLTPISTNPSEKRPGRKSIVNRRPKKADKAHSVSSQLQQQQQSTNPKLQDVDPSSSFVSSSTQSTYASAFSAPVLSNNGSMSFPTNFLFGQPNMYQTLQQPNSQTNFPNSDARPQLSSYSNGIGMLPQQEQQQQQLQSQQQQQSSGSSQSLRVYDSSSSNSGPQTQSALSAAMAASLLAPVNYVGWWQQAHSNPGLMLPYAQPGPLGSRNETKFGGPGLLGTDLISYNQSLTNTPVVGDGMAACRTQSDIQRDSLPPSTSRPTSHSWISSGSGTHSTSQTVREKQEPYHTPSMSYPSSAQMLASLNPFAQAMYYQAATLAATQNGQSPWSSTPALGPTDPHTVSQANDVMTDTGLQNSGSSFPFI